MNRTDRLLAILLELQARGERRAEDLAATFEVSVRTVYRDLQALAESGVPIVATPGIGYRLVEGYFLPPVTLSSDEATVLLLGGEFVRDRVDPDLKLAADSALRKLAGLLADGGRAGAEERQAEVARRRAAIHFMSMGPTPDDARLGVLRSAIRATRAIRLLYHAQHRSAAEPRVVEPATLIHMQDAWYVGGYCRLRRDARLFRLDRVDALDVLDDTFAPGEQHRVHPSRVADEGWPEAVVRFDARVERWVRERPFHLRVREEQDADGTRFVFALRDERELVLWLLSWGAAAEVLSPLSLRATLASEARAVAARHAAAPSDSPRLADMPEPAPERVAMRHDRNIPLRS